MPKATTVRFSDEVFARLDQASARTGMPVNSIVIAACLEWMDRHTQSTNVAGTIPLSLLAPPPRWSTIRRAVEVAVAGRGTPPLYPFERFTESAQKMLTTANVEADRSGYRYIGTEHLLLAAFADPASQSSVMLDSLGIEVQAVRDVLEKVLRGHKGPRNPVIVPTSRVKKVIELAFAECAALSGSRVSTGHILYALAKEGQGIAGHILKDMGATAGVLEARLKLFTEPEA